MFIEICLSDTIRIDPLDFERDLVVVVQDEIHTKYVNRVIPNQGLCLCLKGIDNIGESKLYPGEGFAFVRVQFRMVMFKPFVDETLEGRIHRCDEKGIYISIEFFEDIFIPSNRFQKPSSWDAKQELWKWDYDGHELYMDRDEKIIFRVTSVDFFSQKKATTIAVIKGEEELKPEPIMSIQGSIDEDYFGLVSWW